MVVSCAFLVLCTAFPVTYTGSKLGVTTTVTRRDEHHASLVLRTGPVHIASGNATLRSGTLVLDNTVARVLQRRGVTLLDVTPHDDFIDVRTRVRLLGEVQIRLVRTVPPHSNSQERISATPSAC